MASGEIHLWLMVDVEQNSRQGHTGMSSHGQRIRFANSRKWVLEKMGGTTTSALRVNS